MRHCIGRIFERARKALRPGPGQRETVETNLPADCGDAPTLRLPIVRPGDLPRVELLCAPHGMVVIR